jgi:hypothetical protein
MRIDLTRLGSLIGQTVTILRHGRYAGKAGVVVDTLTTLPIKLREMAMAQATDEHVLRRDYGRRVQFLVKVDGDEVCVPWEDVQLESEVS